MVKIGEVFETATCRNCGKPIKHEYWGNGGTTWMHENDRWDCYEPSVARPAEGTVQQSENGPSLPDGDSGRG